jgi:hypothetical protein
MRGAAGRYHLKIGFLAAAKGEKKRITMPAGLNAAQRKKLERAALTCPVHKSLLEEIEKAITFEYPDELS